MVLRWEEGPHLLRARRKVGVAIVLLGFIVAVTKYPIKTSLRRAGLILARGLGLSPSRWEGVAAGARGCRSRTPRQRHPHPQCD